MSFIGSVFEKVRRHPKRVVFPEGSNPRVLRAAMAFHEEGLGAAAVLGSRDAIQQQARKLKLNLERVGIVDPAKAEDRDRYVELLMELRKSKGLRRTEAMEALKHPIYFATMMLQQGGADALVAGADIAAAAVLRPLFQAIHLEPGVKAVSSCAVLQVADPAVGEGGVLCMADCGVIPDPTVEQLADVAVTAAKLARQLHGVKPRAAFLAYSNKGNMPHRVLDRIRAAVALARQKAGERQVEADFDGELQADVALFADLASLRVPHSGVAGRANVLIFPDLNSGSIASKLIRRLAKATFYGPILNGLSKPASDLAYGCTAEEILGTAAIVALQAIEYRRLYPAEGRAASSRLLY